MGFNDKDNNSNCPCLNCTQRVVGCHSSCSDYIEWGKRVKHKNRKIAEEHILDIEQFYK